MNENNNTQIVEYYLNNEDVYLNSKPYPRSDSYGRDGWFYMNTQAISGQTQADRICNINIYNEESAKTTDDTDLVNSLQLNNIKSLSLKLIINGNESTNDSSETIQSYYPFITIGLRPTGVDDLENADGTTPPNYHALIHLKISPTLTANVNNTDELIYFYKDANGLMYYKNKPEDDDNIFNDNFKNMVIEENPANNSDLNLDIVKDIFITSPSESEVFSVAFLLQEAELQTTNMTSKNFNRKIKFKNIVSNLITNKSELVIHDGALNGLTPIEINTYGYKNVVIYCNVTATAGASQINVFLSFSSDDISYYTDSRNIICQEFGSPGTYTGVIRIKDVGFQFIKGYCTDSTVTNVKIAYSKFN
jgi:hypothetical protein|tara:strand:- start:6736 stop:7824 length:1089 start_codon:yes stop_codon:yes gene_type:complete